MPGDSPVAFEFDYIVAGGDADRTRLQQAADLLQAEGWAARVALLDVERAPATVLHSGRVVLFGLSHEPSCTSAPFLKTVSEFMKGEHADVAHVGIPLVLEADPAIPPAIEHRQRVDLSSDEEGSLPFPKRVATLVEAIVDGRGTVAVPRKVVFVAMPFGDPALTDVYENCVKAAVRAVDEDIDIDIECQNGLDPTGARSIVDQVTNIINDACLVIAELTGDNRNVMWEVGYTQARKRPLILIRQETDSDAPFMVRHVRMVTYQLHDDPTQHADEMLRLRNKLEKEIRTELRL